MVDRITNEVRVHHGDQGFTRGELGRPRLRKSDPVLRFYSYSGLTQHYLRNSQDYLNSLELGQWCDMSQTVRRFTSDTILFLDWLDDVLFYLNGVIHSVYKIDFNKIKAVNKLKPVTSEMETLVSKFKEVEFHLISEKSSEFVKANCQINLLREYIRMTESQFWVVVDKLKLNEAFRYVERVMPYLEIISAFLNRCSDYFYWYMKMLNAYTNNQPYGQWCSTIPKFSFGLK